MQPNIKTGITFGIIAGLLTFLFGGWSVAVIGCLMGIGLGLGLGGRIEKSTPLNMAKEALKPARAASGSLLVLSLIQNFIIQITKSTPFNMAMEALKPALAASGSLLVLSLIQNFLIQSLIGKFPEDWGTFIGANLIGFFGSAFLTCLVVSFGGFDKKTEQTLKMLLLAAVVIAFPFVDNFTELRWTAQIIFALIFVILGLGLNIVVGYAGLLDLGYAAFFAIGAYTTGILSSPVHNTEWNFWLVIWIAAAMAGLWGLMLGAPTLPLRGDYLAIVTLGFGEIVPVLFKNLIDVTIKEPFTCWIWPALMSLFGGKSTLACITFVEHEDLTLGEKGISPIGRPSLPLISPDEAIGFGLYFKIALMLLVIGIVAYYFMKSRSQGNKNNGQLFVFLGLLATIIFVFIPIPRPGFWPIDNILSFLQPGDFESSKPITWYFLIVLLIILSVFIINRLRDSRLGRAWMAIREDELAAAQMGIDPVKTKLAAFAMGAMFSGFAGAFYAAYIRGIFPSVFDFSASIIILCVVILGGIGNINGVIVGGLVLMTADRLFLPALKDFLTALLTNTVLPAISNPAVQSAVKDNANPILYRFLLFGLTLVIMMAVRPEGLIPNEQVRAELHANEEDQLPEKKG